MSSSLSITSGGFTIGGFKANATTLGGYNSSFANSGPFADFFAVAPQTDEAVFNWSAASASSTFPAGPQVVSVTASGVEKWTLKISLNATNSSNNNKITYYQPDGITPIVQAGAAGNPAGIQTSFSLTGSGDSALQSLFQALDVRVDAGNVVGVTFTLTDDTRGSAATNWTEYFLACFTAGTRIATPAGEIAVEALQIGDRVMTRSGVAKPVKWIGRRSYTAAQVAANPQLQPVIVRQDALAAGMPHRDLAVSAMHGLLIDDVMVPAVSLVNGVSILRSDELVPVAYFHVEMDDHDVVFADGAPAETFVDDNSRVMFENSDEYFDLYGAQSGTDAFSTTRVLEGYQLDALRRRLAVRAGATTASVAPGALLGHVEAIDNGVLRGWVVDQASPTTAVELDVMADGEIIGRVIANRYRVDLDHARLAGGCCGFSLAVPAAVVSLAQVGVSRVADCVRLPVQAVPELTH